MDCDSASTVAILISNKRLHEVSAQNQLFMTKEESNLYYQIASSTMISCYEPIILQQYYSLCKHSLTQTACSLNHSIQVHETINKMKSVLSVQCIDLCMMQQRWTDDIKGLLVDATGVLYQSDQYGGYAIPDSVEAVERLVSLLQISRSAAQTYFRMIYRLQNSDIPFKICSNQSTQTQKSFIQKLNSYGFNLTSNDVMCPGPLIAELLKCEQRQPYLLVHPGMNQPNVSASLSVLITK